MTDDIVKCDGCNHPGRRRREHPCPDGWFFLESKVASRRGVVHIVWACSEACRDSLWQRGPGPATLDEEGSARMQKREAQS